MKLGAAIEEFILYKQALGWSYKGPANVLKAFLRRTGNLELGALTAQHCDVFLPIQRGMVTEGWFKKYEELDRFFRFATNRGYMRHRILPSSLPERPPDFVPYIYSTEDMHRLLGVPDSHYPPTCSLAPDTMRTLVLLLYGTGLRLGEAIKLTLRDADLANAVLTIRETKFGKSRLVPIGRDLVGILRLYRKRHWRNVKRESAMPFLLTNRNTAVRHDHADHQFQWLRQEAGVLRFDNARYQPRLRDFRHTFAVTRLVTCYRDQGDVQRLLPLLSTYLGHCRVNETAAYLRMTRELLAEANRCFERYAFEEGHHA